MGKGIDAARDDAPIHAAVLDDLKDQLLIVLMKRLADSDGKVSIPVHEVNNTSMDLLSFNVRNDVFNFELSKKS